MQIVIDISEKVYGLLKYFEPALGFDDKKDGNDDVKTALMRAVINGTPLPRWTPISEKLPEEDEWVLITYYYDREIVIEIALLDEDGWYYREIDNPYWIAEHPPIAWMPLPEPYTESET